MTKTLTGGCCCGEVAFSLQDNFSQFYFCHCEQCRKLTGSAHASNLFTSPDNIKWTKGEDNLVRYDHPTRTFSKVFCKVCGSGLPFVTQSGRLLIVPAGSLNEEPTIDVKANIFCAEQPKWYKAGLAAEKLDGFP